MYTYIYIYIYIYRILLNKSVLYTVAIYTTVLDGRLVHQFAHFPTVHCEKEKETEKKREEREEVPFEKILPPFPFQSSLPQDISILGMYGGADSLSVNRVRRVIRS